MGDSNDETSPDQVGASSSRVYENEEGGPSVRTLLTMMREIRIATRSNFSLPLNTSEDLASLKATFRSFQTEVITSLVHITKTLDNNKRNHNLLSKTSADMASLKDSFKSFQTEVNASLVHIIKTLDNLNQVLKVTSESKDIVKNPSRERLPVLGRDSQTIIEIMRKETHDR